MCLPPLPPPSFFSPFSVKCSLRMVCAWVVARDLAKILSCKDLQLKSVGIRT